VLAVLAVEACVLGVEVARFAEEVELIVVVTGAVVVVVLLEVCRFDVVGDVVVVLAAVMGVGLVDVVGVEIVTDEVVLGVAAGLIDVFVEVDAVVGVGVVDVVGTFVDCVVLAVAELGATAVEVFVAVGEGFVVILVDDVDENVGGVVAVVELIIGAAGVFVAVLAVLLLELAIVKFEAEFALFALFAEIRLSFAALELTLGLAGIFFS
jgi:hypothetical protein